MPKGTEYEIKSNQTILNLAQDNNIHIKSVCKGIPSCSECRVQIAEGEYNVMPPSQTELSLIGTAYFVDQSRLACQLRCFGDVVIDLSEQEEKATEAVSSKRPRGRAQKAEGEESQAVMGNIMLDEEEQSTADVNERTANLTLEEEERRRELERIRRQRSPREERAERPRKPRPKAQTSAPDNTDRSEKPDSDKKPNRNRKRRRNRNRKPKSKENA